MKKRQQKNKTCKENKRKGRLGVKKYKKEREKMNTERKKKDKRQRESSANDK